MKNTSGSGILAAAVLAAFALAAPFPSSAQEVNENARALLEKAMRDTAGLSAVGVDFSASTRVTQDKDSGQEVNESGFSGEILLRGDADLRMKVREKDGDGELEVISNGKVHNIYIPGEKRCDRLEQEVPRAVLVAAPLGGLLNVPAVWLSDFLHGNTDLLQNARSISHAGTREIGGQACDGISLSYESFDLVAWLAPGEVRRLVQTNADLSKWVQTQAHAGLKISAEVVFQFSNWRANPELKDEQFVFTPPEGVKVNERREPEPTLKTGTAAPDFTLPLLKGGEMTLSAEKGKVVVLDFWATWCGPCRQAMPVVDKVVHAHQDQGVKLYAVNQAEDPQKVSEFLQSRKMDILVPLDKDGKVGDLFGVQGIPHIVVIDRKGLVVKVFQGVGPDFEEALDEAVQKALAS